MSRIHKQLIAVICVAFVLISIGGCTVSNGAKYASQSASPLPMENNDDASESTVEPEPVQRDTTGMYHTLKPDSWVLIPEDYTLFTRDMDEHSDALTQRGITRKDIINFLDAYDAEFAAMTPDGGMEVMLKFKQTGIGFNDLRYAGDDTVSDYANGLTLSFSADTYELVESNNLLWVKLPYSQPIAGASSPADVVRYVSVADGWDIFIWGSCYDGKMTPQDLEDLQSLVNSFFLSDN